MTRRRAVPRRIRRPPIPVELRQAIYARDRYRCLYCFVPFLVLPHHLRTLDHLIPWSEGGESVPGNLIAACRGCNNRRNRTPFDEFASLDALDRIYRSIARPIEPYLPQLPRPARKR